MRNGPRNRGRRCVRSSRFLPEMYHGTVRTLPDAVYKYICKEGLLKPGDRVGIAVSGGADSVALLLVMLELRKKLGIVLAVVHFNHKLRGPDSEADEQFVAELSARFALEFFREAGSVVLHSAQQHLSLEAAGRSLRYEYFSRLLGATTLNRIATAHTLDDQAETVLLKVVRGAGTRGLSAIYPRLAANELPGSHGVQPPGSGKSVIRPLLGIRRENIESYLRAREQTWREDKTNSDVRYSRNLVRHEILPQLERSLNPSVRETLAETSDVARAEEEYWTDKVGKLLPDVWKLRNDDVERSLDAVFLSTQPLALQRRLVRAAAASLGLRLEFKHVEQILELSSDQRCQPSSTILPGGWMAARSRNEIHFLGVGSESSASVNYEYILPVPGQVIVPEAGRLIEAILVRSGDESGYNPDHALDATLLADELRIRNWRPGDRFWPAHSKGPKKIKELLQRQKLTGIVRKTWPVVVSGNEVIWLGGFPTPIAVRPAKGEREAIILRETML